MQMTSDYCIIAFESFYFLQNIVLLITTSSQPGNYTFFLNHKKMQKISWDGGKIKYITYV